MKQQHRSYHHLIPQQQQQNIQNETLESNNSNNNNNNSNNSSNDSGMISETEIQKNEYLDHFHRLKKLLFKFERIVQDEKNNGIVELVTETPLQDKEALMKSIVTELQKMVFSLEKMVFIEAAHLLTAESEDDIVVESMDQREDEVNRDLFETEEEENEDDEDDEDGVMNKKKTRHGGRDASSLEKKKRRKLHDNNVFMQEFVEDDTVENEFDESFTPVDSALFNQLKQILQYIGSNMERGEVACSLLTRIYDLITRLSNEYSNAPPTLLKQPFFKDNALVRFNTDMFNQLLKSYASHGSNQDVVIVLQDMKEREIKANSHTYHALVQLAMYHGDYVRATKILDYARQCGFEPLPETLALFNEDQDEDF